MKTKVFVQIFVLALLIFSVVATELPVEAKPITGPLRGWNGSAYVGLKAPFAGTFKITGDRTTHGGTNRHAIDIGMNQQPVLAMHGGTVMAYKPNNGAAGNELDIDHGDGYCSAYLHLKSVNVQKGQVVKQGDLIAVSGNTGGVAYHLHVEVNRIVNGSCNTSIPHTPEVPMYFDEIPNRELNKGDLLTSDNNHPPSGFAKCAMEGEACTFDGTAYIIYGGGNYFTSPRLFTNSVACNNSIFGDPLSGARKTCYYSKIIPTCPSPINGWKTEFFNSIDLSGNLVACQDNPNVDFAWDINSPAPGVSADNFSARFTRVINFPMGEYTFYLAGDDGVRLFVDGNKIIDQWFDHGFIEYSGKVNLTEGSHTVVVEYYENAAAAAVRLRWEKNGPIVHPRESMVFDNIYTGSVDALNYEKWSFGFGEPLDFTITAARTSGDVDLRLILQDSNGTELYRAEGGETPTLSGNRPAGSYFVLVQPISGSGAYTIKIVNTTVQPQVASSKISCPTIVTKGETFTCTLFVDPANISISGLQVNLSGFNGLLENVGSPQFSNKAGSDSITSLSDNNKIIWAGTNGELLKVGDLAILTFKAIQSGTVTFSGQGVAADTANMPITLKMESISITVNEGSVTPPPKSSISGNAKLDSGIAPSRASAILLDAAGQPVSNAQVNSDGTYALTNIEPGTYTLRLKAPGYLAAQKPVTLVAGQTLAIPNVILLSGDVTGDDKIDPLDVMAIGKVYESGSLSLPEADLNGDGVVNLFDLTLLAKNWRITGPIPIN